MIIYNVTTLVSWPVHEEWRSWMVNEYLPALLSTNLFTHYQMVRLLEVNEEEGATYAVQLYMNSKKEFILYQDMHLRAFQKMERAAWGDNATSFASLMEVVN